jgi:hypothetical protein
VIPYLQISQPKYYIRIKTGGQEVFREEIERVEGGK